VSKKFRIAKRISMKDIDHFEDIEVDDDFVDKDMVQIIADNEYDPMYDDCENIAVALQLAGYGKVTDLEAKLAESEKESNARYESWQEEIRECDRLRVVLAEVRKQLAESEEKKESYRLQNDEHHLQLCQFYSRLGVEAFGADIHEKALETLMIMKEELEEKNGVRRALSACNRQNDEFADMIKELVNENEELKQQLAEKDEAIENWQTMYESVVQTCHNDKEEIESLTTDLQEALTLIKEGVELADLNNKALDRTKQDKISFAVEQLEFAQKYIQQYVNNFDDMNDCLYAIDNQIKQLKEME
jgi:uncharacterized coiled-coil DUF342 family protein